MQLVRQELLGTRVFVFTRNGRILNLARGATVTDAAAHLGISLRSHTPIVNGGPAPERRELQNGDIVSFEVFPLGYSLPSNPTPPNWATGSVVSTSGLSDAPPPLGVPPDALLAPERARQYLESRQVNRQACTVSSWTVCSHCQPLPGEPLRGAVNSRKTGTLHRANCGCVVDAPAGQAGVGGNLLGQIGVEACPALRKQVEVEGFDPFQATEAGEAGEATGGQAEATDAALQKAIGDLCDASGTGLGCTLVVCCRDRKGMLLDVSTAVTHEASNIMNVHSEIFVPGAESAFQYKVTLHSVAQLQRLVAAVSSVPDVTRVIRGNLEDLGRQQQQEGSAPEGRSGEVQ